MDRKAMAQETLEIMKQGYYEPEIKNESGQKAEKRQILIKEDMEQSIRRSTLISPAEGEKILEKYSVCANCSQPETRVDNTSTVDAIRLLAEEGKTDIGVLNFASAKNPGGGFLNGAKAQEESLTVSGTLYPTLTAHEEYYKENRAHRSMMYLDYGIYSPEVVFFRDGAFRLTETPVKASVLTLPAVNMGQVILKGENEEDAKRVMRRRMKLALGIFAEQKAKHLVLGAYGCGVFRNDPREVAAWWRELLEEGMGQYFDSVFHAVLDNSREQCCIKAFQEQTMEVHQ
ncbi:MAG: TIGR02452 family protein [Acetatifactor sp.]|nr:TIGR02452 family protein [Acetatifactor sp.]